MSFDNAPRVFWILHNNLWFFDWKYFYIYWRLWCCHQKWLHHHFFSDRFAVNLSSRYNFLSYISWFSGFLFTVLIESLIHYKVSLAVYDFARSVTLDSIETFVHFWFLKDKAILGFSIYILPLILVIGVFVETIIDLRDIFK